MTEGDFEWLDVVPKLPNTFGIDRAEAVPDDLVGATIVAFGSLPDAQFEGPLVLDYRTAAGDAHRLVIGFNETGAWVRWKGSRESPPPSSSRAEVAQ